VATTKRHKWARVLLPLPWPKRWSCVRCRAQKRVETSRRGSPVLAYRHADGSLLDDARTCPAVSGKAW
jgi:hypothetical protein